MPHLDEEDIELVLKAIERRDLDRVRLAHPEDFNADGTPKVHTRSVKRRVGFVVVVIVALAGADHVIHLEWIVRVCEMGTAAFFDWWFNVAKAGEMKLPLPKVRRKAKATTD